jgi:ribosomal protein S18 acetylase RimI-like enzyme
MRRGASGPSVKVVIKELDQSSAGDIVALHRRSFPLDVVERSIFHCPQVVEYIRCLLACPPAVRCDLFFGVLLDARLIGYAQLRHAGDALHLNQIAVDPAYRGRSVGRLLVDRWFEEARACSLQRLTLDVETANQVAWEWYRRLGFTEVNRKRVYAVRNPPASSQAFPADVCIVDWAAQEATYRAFGFSEMTVVWGERTWRIGRLGEGWLRLSWPVPEWLLQRLSLLFPGRRFLVLSDEPVDLPTASLLAETVRLSRDVQ